METKNLLGESGIVITLILVLIPVLFASIIVIIKAYATINNYTKGKALENFNDYLKGLSTEEVAKLEQQKRALEFTLSNNELAGETVPIDKKD